MKNVNRKALSVVLTLIMVICAMFTPMLTVNAEDRNIYSRLEVKELGAEWDAWNSMNNTNFDEKGWKVPTSEYLEVVSDPTNSGHGGVLKIGHADYKTSLGLRLSVPTDINYSHKLETQFYIDGELSSGSVLIRDREMWDDSTPYDQTSVNIANMEKGKWVTVNTENVAAKIDGLSGNSYYHIHDGAITIIFTVTLEKGNYFYMDNLNIAAGNPKTYEKNIDTENGDKIIYSHEFKTFDELDVTPVTEINDWTVSNGANIGKITTENGNTEILVYSSSIVQVIDGLPNGKYNISIDYCNNGNTSSILTAHDITADGWKNQKNLILQEVSYGMHTATLSGYEITDNCLRISVWAGAQEGKFVKVDNVTITKEDSDQNVVLNGGFEVADTPIDNPTEKASRAVGWGNWIGSGLSNDSIFVADTGYNSTSSMAVTYPVDGGSNFNQTVKGLTGGKTYVITAHVKMSENAAPRLYIKNYGGGSTNYALPNSDTWTLFYKEFTLPETGTQFTLEFYCGGTAGDWFMVDNIKVIEKDEASITNLVTNGDFETIVGDIDGDSVIKGSDLTKLRNGLMNSSEFILSLADVNNDSVVDAIDIVRMKKYIAGTGVILGAN